jgi:transposase
MLFPEIQTFFSPIYSPTVMSLLAKFPSATDIARANISKLRSILSTGRMKLDKADRLKALAKTSIGICDDGAAFELKLVVQRITFLQNQKQLLDAEIQAVMNKIKSPITTIPGIGTVLGAIILAEIGDRVFQTPAKLLAFAGCEPATYQSGNYTATKTKMVKHGSRYLRWALFLATKAARIYSPSFSGYISRKKSQGKHEFVALSHGTKKLVRVIHAVLSKNIPYTEPF